MRPLRRPPRCASTVVLGRRFRMEGWWSSMPSPTPLNSAFASRLGLVVDAEHFEVDLLPSPAPSGAMVDIGADGTGEWGLLKLEHGRLGLQDRLMSGALWAEGTLTSGSESRSVPLASGWRPRASMVVDDERSSRPPGPRIADERQHGRPALTCGRLWAPVSSCRPPTSPPSTTR